MKLVLECRQPVLARDLLIVGISGEGIPKVQRVLELATDESCVTDIVGNTELYNVL